MSSKIPYFNPSQSSSSVAVAHRNNGNQYPLPHEKDKHLYQSATSVNVYDVQHHVIVAHATLLVHYRLFYNPCLCFSFQEFSYHRFKNVYRSTPLVGVHDIFFSFPFLYPLTTTLLACHRPRNIEQ